MGKNTIGGKKHKRGKNNSNPIKRLLQTRQEGESYAKIINLLGNSRLQCQCYDVTNEKEIKDKKNTAEYKLTERIGVIRGSMRKRVWIRKDDIVLVSIREYQDDKCDIIWKYTPEEIEDLKSMKELPNIKSESNNNESNIVFGNDLIPESDESDNESNNEEIEEIQPVYNKNKSNSSFEEDLDNI